MRERSDVIDLGETIGLTLWESFIVRACTEVAETFLNGGWRGSKTWGAVFVALLIIILRWLGTGRDRLIWLIGPDYEQAREEYFTLTGWLDFLGIKGEVSNASQGPLTAKFPLEGGGTLTIATKSAENPTSLGSVAPDLIIACEAGQISEEGRDRIRGRTSTKNAPIIWSGTFENDKGRPQFVWFEEESAEVARKPTPRKRAFSLPSWDNLALFGSCKDMVEEDPSLAMYCPQDGTPHGEAHAGLDPDPTGATKGIPRHPKLRELWESLRNQPKKWRKFYGGEPTGVSDPVYEWTQVDNTEDFESNTYLKPMPAELCRILTAGGMDFGTVHPSAITLASVMENGETWVWKSLKDESGDLDWIWDTKKALTRIYGVHRWGADPMVKYNPTFLEVEAMSGSLFAREARVGLVEGVKKKRKLYFDSNDAGVVLLFREMQQVHRRKGANGTPVYVRENDDMTASFEDAIAMLHGTPTLKVSNRQRLPAYRRREPVIARSAS